MRTPDMKRFSLPASAWVILGGELISAIGSGATIPYLIVYLNKVCGVAVAAAAALMIVRAVIGVAGAMAGGPLTDRIGSRSAAAVTLFGAGVASLALALASGQPVLGLAAAALVTAAQLMCVPALDTLLAVSVPQARRQTAFAWRQTAINLGGAGGAAIAALVVSKWSAAEGLPVVYILDGASFIAYGITIFTVVRVGGKATSPSGEPGGSEDFEATEATEGSKDSEKRSGYRLVFADRPMRWLCVIVAIVASAGYTQLEVGLPALVTNGGIDVAGLGWMFTVNMIVVMGLQLPVQRLVIGRSRAAVLASAMAIMAATWILVVVGLDQGTLMLVTVGAVFGIAETLYTPVVPALVNDLALPRIRGRYNGAQAVTWTAGWLMGAAAAAIFLATGPSGARPLFLACIVVLVIGLAAAVKLRRALPPGLTKVPDPASDSADHTAPEVPEHTVPDPRGEKERSGR